MSLVQQIVTFVCIVFLSSAVAQDAASPKAATKKIADTKRAVTEHWHGVADELSKEYVFAPVDALDKPFQLQQQAIFRHTQTVRDDDIGSVYVWKETSGRPAIIGVVFGWSEGRVWNVMHEFHSLHRKGITMDLPGKKNWSTNRPGLEWASFPGAEIPQSSQLKHRLQARVLSRRVSASATDPAKARWELRLVPTAIYEYAVPDEGVDYGAMFSLCQGTDTELLVILEARREEDRRSEWQYAFACFTDYQLAVAIDGQKTWESAAGRSGEDGKPHYWDFVEQRPKPDFER